MPSNPVTNKSIQISEIRAKCCDESIRKLFSEKDIVKDVKNFLNSIDIRLLFEDIINGNTKKPQGEMIRMRPRIRLLDPKAIDKMIEKMFPKK
jgi:hypothetical protein